MKRRAADVLSKFRVDRRSRTPLYVQLYRALRTAIRNGRLPAGARLPSSRTLAQRLDISRNTVLNAYESLLADGLANGKVGAGTRVADGSSKSHGTTIVDPDGNPIHISG